MKDSIRISLGTTFLVLATAMCLLAQDGIRITGIWGGPNFTFSTFESQNDLQVGGFLEVEISERIVLGGRFSNPRYKSDKYKNDLWGDYREGYAKYMFGSGPIRGYTGIALGRAGVSPILIDASEDASYTTVITPLAGIDYNLHRNVRIGAFVGYRIVGDEKYRVHPGDVPLNSKDLSTPIFGVRISGGLNWRN